MEDSQAESMVDSTNLLQSTSFKSGPDAPENQSHSVGVGCACTSFGYTVRASCRNSRIRWRVVPQLPGREIRVQTGGLPRLALSHA